MATMVTMSTDELAALVASTVAATMAANGGKVAKAKAVKEISPEVKAAVIAAVKADPRKTPGVRKDGSKYDNGYKCFTGMMIAGSLKKYGDKAEFQNSTYLAAAKGYGIEVK